MVNVKAVAADGANHNNTMETLMVVHKFQSTQWLRPRRKEERAESEERRLSISATATTSSTFCHRWHQHKERIERICERDGQTQKSCGAACVTLSACLRHYF
jgi:hypothetical protein